MDVPLPAACSPTPPAPSPPAAPAGETVRVQSTYLAYTQNTITLPPPGPGRRSPATPFTGTSCAWSSPTSAR